MRSITLKTLVYIDDELKGTILTATDSTAEIVEKEQNLQLKRIYKGHLDTLQRNLEDDKD